MSALPRHSETCTLASADGPLRIPNLDLSEYLSGPLVQGVHTPGHIKECQEWARTICDHSDYSIL
jgi:hypothetical protein